MVSSFSAVIHCNHRPKWKDQLDVGDTDTGTGTDTNGYPPSTDKKSNSHFGSPLPLPSFPSLFRFFRTVRLRIACGPRTSICRPDVSFRYSARMWPSEQAMSPEEGSLWNFLEWQVGQRRLGGGMARGVQVGAQAQDEWCLRLPVNRCPQ